MSGPRGSDVFRLIGYIQDDLRQTQAKLVELRAMLSNLSLPEDRPEYRCTVEPCGLLFGNQTKLDDHLSLIHGVLRKDG